MQTASYRRLLRALGDTIQKQRKALGLTQEQAGEMLSLDRVSVGYIEQGHRAPSLRTLFSIAEAYGVPIGHLFADVDKGRPAAAPTGEISVDGNLIGTAASAAGDGATPDHTRLTIATRRKSNDPMTSDSTSLTNASPRESADTAESARKDERAATRTTRKASVHASASPQRDTQGSHATRRAGRR